MMDSSAQSEQAESTGLIHDTIDSINHETQAPNPVLDQLFDPQSDDYLDFTSDWNVLQGFDTFPATGNAINFAFITNSKIRNAIMNQVICMNVKMRHPRITNTTIAEYSDKNQIPTTTVLDYADIDGAILLKCIIVDSEIDNSDIVDSTFTNVKLISPVFCPSQALGPLISVQDNSMDSGLQNNHMITPDTSFDTFGNAIPSLETEDSSALDMQGGDRNEMHMAFQPSLNLENARGPAQGFKPEISSHEEPYNEGHVESSTENATILPTAQSPIGTYATPISNCSAPCDKGPTPSITPKKRTKKQSTSQRKIRRQKEPEPREENINGTIFGLLQNCFDKEKEKNVTKKAREVQTVADYMIVNDCHALLQPQLKKWRKNLSSDKHALGFPPLERSATAAAKYFELLQSKRLLKYSLEHRMALVCFYLIYLEIAREMRDNEDLGDYEPRSGDDRFTTMANDKILAALHGIKIQSLSKEKIDFGRAKLNEFRRWGKRWWTLASGAGLGVLLVPSEQLAMVM